MKHFLSLMFLAIAVSHSGGVRSKVGGRLWRRRTVSSLRKPLPIRRETPMRIRNPGVALSAWLDNNIGSGLFGGELRYDHENGGSEAFLRRHQHHIRQSKATPFTTISSLNFTSSEAAVRPFVSAGGGVKWYSGTGTEQVYQPLSNIAVFSDVRDMRPHGLRWAPA